MSNFKRKVLRNQMRKAGAFKRKKGKKNGKQ